MTTTETEKCEYRARHEYGDDGCCNHCFKRRPELKDEPLTPRGGDTQPIPVLPMGFPWGPLTRTTWTATTSFGAVVYVPTLEKFRLDELQKQNEAIARHEQLEQAMKDSISSASAEWSAVLGAGQGQSVDQFRIATQYMGDLSRQSRELAAKGVEMAALRDELIERVLVAQRSVEAAEQHRDDMKAEFVQQRLSGEFKIADDQWNTLQSGANSNGN